MPELPEVETAKSGIEPHIIHQSVVDIIVRHKKLRIPVPVRQLRQKMVGQTVGNVYRRAKYLLIEFPTGTLLLHLGMSGSLRILPQGTAPQKHDHIDVEFGNGLILRFTDPRRFGLVDWITGDPFAHKLLVDLGPEPLTDDFDGQVLFDKSRKRTQAVKLFIMDSHVVVGVGNIYANEALFKAGIHPERASGSIELATYKRLAKAIKQILAKAIKVGGTTLRDFTGGDGQPGYFKQSLLVYGRAGQECKNCNHMLIELRLGGRSTVFCEHCQT